MDKSIIISEEVKAYFTAHATLAALGRKVCEMKLFEPICEKVKIAQKTVKYTPIEKLIDAEIAILAGAQGMVEINKRVRPDRGLQAAFGRAWLCGTIGRARYAGCLHNGECCPNASGTGYDLPTIQSGLSS